MNTITLMVPITPYPQGDSRTNWFHYAYRVNGVADAQYALKLLVCAELGRHKVILRDSSANARSRSYMTRTYAMKLVSRLVAMTTFPGEALSRLDLGHVDVRAESRC